MRTAPPCVGAVRHSERLAFAPDRNCRYFATKMKITWMLTHKVVPGTRESPPPDFTAFDGEEAIGRIHQIVDGPERGLWSWTMTAVRAGPTPTFPTSGR